MEISKIARRYMTTFKAEEDPTEGEVPAGFTPITIAGYNVILMVNRLKVKCGMETGSKLTQVVGGRVVSKGAITCGPL